MRNYERVLKILDLCEEIVTSKEFKGHSFGCTV